MKLPITFFYPLVDYSEKTRPAVMREFAANGARHLIVTERLFRVFMQDGSMAGRIAAEMEREGLSFVDGHAPSSEFLDLNCPDESRRHEMIIQQKRALNIAAELGLETLTIHCGLDFIHAEIPLQLHVQRVKDALEQLLDEAEKCRVVIAIENIWTPNCQPDVLLDIKKDFPSDYLGFCYDAGHANLVDERHVRCFNQAQNDWLKILKLDRVKWEGHALEKMLPHIVTCHLHDNDGSCDQHRRIGSGNVDWPHVKKLLMQAPRLKCIQSEVHPEVARASIKDLCRDMEFFSAQ